MGYSRVSFLPSLGINNRELDFEKVWSSLFPYPFIKSFDQDKPSFLFLVGVFDQELIAKDCSQTNETRLYHAPYPAVVDPPVVTLAVVDPGRAVVTPGSGVVLPPVEFPGVVV
jgi:hypothetical protein